MTTSSISAIPITSSIATQASGDLNGVNGTHWIIGAGLIGGYLAAHIAHELSDVPLHVLGRTHMQSHFDRLIVTSMKAQRLCVDPSNLHFHSTISTDSHSADIIWLTVKCTAIEQALQDITPIVQGDTVIICCQNGLGTHERVQQAYPDNQVLRVVVPFNVVLLSTGHWHRSSSGAVAFEDAPLTRILSAALQCATMPTAIESDITAYQWAKCQINLTNSVNALSNLSLKDTLLDKGYRLVIAKMMREHLAVCHALGYTLPKVTHVPNWVIPHVMSLPTWWFTKIAKKMVDIDPQARLSMWWDINQSRPTEIDFINGAVAQAARELGLTTPTIDRVVLAIRQLSCHVEQGGVRYSVPAKDLLKE